MQGRQAGASYFYEPQQVMQQVENDKISASQAERYAGYSRSQRGKRQGCCAVFSHQYVRAARVNLSARNQGPLRDPALGLRVADATDVLRAALDQLERTAGRAVRTEHTKEKKKRHRAL